MRSVPQERISFFVSDFPFFLSDYTYEHPESLIAYEPTAKRPESRLLLVRKNPQGGLPQFEDALFSELPQIVEAHPELKNKLLVRNRTRVLPARFYACRKSGSRHEIVLTDKVGARTWKALIRNVAKMKFPEVLSVEGDSSELVVTAPDQVFFETEEPEEILQRVGRVPLPPYIRREQREEDRDRYQTVWAQGAALSAAAPTASLHFDDHVWESVLSKGVKSADVFLHVGRGTFESLRENDLSKAKLHEEAFEVSSVEYQKIKEAHSVWAIGTTACRLVESLSSEHPDFVRFEERSGGTFKGWTSLFIRPGFKFSKVDTLLTNFHLPQSSLLVLVSVFAGSWTLAREAYAHAVAKKYRLFSYGDASLWI